MPRIEIVGDAEKAAKYTTWARGEWAKVDGTKYGYVDGFAIQYINHDGEGVIRFVELASHAFLCTPRTGTRWSSRKVWPGVSGYAISDGRVFALNAKGEIYEGGEYEPFLVGGGAYSPAFQVKKDDEVVVKYPKAGKPNLYGNMLWVSDVGDKILSWQSKYSPGIPHIQMTEPFQAILYQDGDIFQPQPPGSVLGAGRYEKRLYVVCMDGADTIAAILNGREWLELGRWSTGRLKTPFLLSGNTFSSADGKTITVTEESAEYSTRTSTDSGTATESGENTDLTFTKSATGWFNGIETRITSRTSSSSSSSSDTDEQTFDVILSGPHVWSAGIDGPETISVGAVYHVVGVQGMCCEWSWSVGAQFEISESGTKTSIMITGGISGCGTGTITATSDTGYSVSKDIRFPSGVWVFKGRSWTGPLSNVADSYSCGAWPPGPPVYCMHDERYSSGAGSGLVRYYMWTGYCANAPGYSSCPENPTVYGECYAPDWESGTQFPHNKGCYADPGYTGYSEYILNSYPPFNYIGRWGACKYCEEQYEWVCP